MSKKLLIACVVMMTLLFIMTRWQAGKIDDLNESLTKLEKDNSSLTNQLSQQININKDYQARITRLNQLDVRHSQELASAKNEIDRLRDAVNSGSKRVYIKAECPKVKTTPSTSLAYATTARPTDTAIRNYWLLRERIAESEQMIKGLQDYIKQECM
ncbi:TPA: lysis protein, partial [Proteus mirabilis]